MHLADDLIYSEVGCLEQMRAALREARYERPRRRDRARAIRPAATASWPCRTRRTARSASRGSSRSRGPKDAPSNLAVVGRYILTPAIFGKLERTQRGAGGEIQLTDGIASLLADEPVHVLPFTGIRYDCGSKIGYLRATVEYGLRHPELGASFRAYLQNVWER